MIDPRIRDYNRRVAMPAIERLRKDGRYVAVRINDEGLVIQVRPVPPPPPCFQPEPGVVVHGPIPYRSGAAAKTLSDVIREVRATPEDIAQTSPDDEVIEEIKWGGTD